MEIVLIQVLSCLLSRSIACLLLLIFAVSSQGKEGWCVANVDRSCAVVVGGGFCWWLLLLVEWSEWRVSVFVCREGMRGEEWKVGSGVEKRSEVQQKRLRAKQSISRQFERIECALKHFKCTHQRTACWERVKYTLASRHSGCRKQQYFETEKNVGRRQPKNHLCLLKWLHRINSVHWMIAV